MIEFPVSERVADRAVWLLEHRMVRLILPTRDGTPPGAVVLGGSDDYHVWFTGHGALCECIAGSEHGPTAPRCAHAVAAMILWQEVLGQPAVDALLREGH